jgi:hypothetical protein
LQDIIAGLDPAILLVATGEDARVKPGHDEEGEWKERVAVMFDRRLAQ